MKLQSVDIKRRICNSCLGTAVVVALLFLGSSDSYGQFPMGNTLAPIPGNDYPIVFANDAKGGHHQVANITARNAITTLRRQVGMLCTVLDNGDATGLPKTYQLICADTKAARDDNASWVVFAPGGGGNTGDVTLATGQSYLTITGQTITAGLVDLASSTKGLLSASSVPDITGDVVIVAGTLRTDIKSTAVTYDKMQRLSTHNLLLGSDATGSTTAVSEIALGSNLSMTGNTLNATGSGDVKGPAANTDGYIPLWDGATSKLLKDGIAVPTGGLAGLSSPVFTNIPTAPTAATADSSLQLATTAFVNVAVKSAAATNGILYQGTSADTAFSTLTWAQVIAATNLGNIILSPICNLSTSGYTWVAFPSAWGNQSFFYHYGSTSYAVIDGLQKRVIKAAITGSVDYQIWFFNTKPDRTVSLIANNN